LGLRLISSSLSSSSISDAFGIGTALPYVAFRYRLNVPSLAMADLRQCISHWKKICEIPRR